MTIPPKKRALNPWIWVFLCSIGIFLTIPVARSIQSYISSYLGKMFFIYLVFGLLGLAFIILFYFLVFKLKIHSVSNYIWLIVLSGGYVYFTLELKEMPPEALHFLEYGLLSFFLFKALKFHIKDESIYLSATLLCLLIGTFDEILQWITPQRFWAFKDVWLNALSGALFLLAIWKVIRPKIITEKINIKSIAVFSSILSFSLIILGLCASNTPHRVNLYTKKINWLSSLQKEEPMSEFGFKHKNQDIGVFYSRLSQEDIRTIDTSKHEQNSQILNKNKNKEYEQFLKEFNPSVNPFLYELRIHIFRRDRYYETGNSSPSANDKEDAYFIAYKENLILLKYFTQTILNSIYAWDKNKITEIEAYIDKNKPYKSPVSAHLFTSFSEKTMWIVISSIIAFLVTINVILPIREKKKTPSNI